MTSIFFVKKGKVYFLLPFFFFIALAIEYTCLEMKLRGYNNRIVYNWWFAVEFVVFILWLNTYIHSTKKNTWFKYIAALYLIFALVTNVSFTRQNEFNTKSFVTGIILLLYIIITIIYQLISSDQMANPLYQPAFWLVVGFLVSYLTGFFHFLANNYLFKNNKELLLALRKINYITSCLMYFFIFLHYAIQWKDRKQRIS